MRIIMIIIVICDSTDRMRGGDAPGECKPQGRRGLEPGLGQESQGPAAKYIYMYIYIYDMYVHM